MRTEQKLSSYLDDYFNWHLSGNLEARDAVDSEELARALERNGYCSEPYFAYERALCCPINKRGETECNMALCESYKFCKLLRREGYICKK